MFVPFQIDQVIPYVDIVLACPQQLKSLLPSWRKKSVTWETPPQEVVPRLATARIVFLNTEGFDTWTDILLSMAQKRPLAMQICIIAGSDYALADEQMEAMLAFFPTTQFWIQNWCGSKVEAIRALPIGTMGQPVPHAARHKPLGISFLKYYHNNPKRVEFFACLQKHPELLACCLQQGGWEIYCSQLSECYFSTCPMGEGFDTFRFWESLMMGAIPVVKDHPFYDTLCEYYPNLPIVRVKEWEDLVLWLPRLTPEYALELWAKSDLSCLDSQTWIGVLQVAAHKN